jgi:acid stress-induced BolA-like protein IbaG/YrbA
MIENEKLEQLLLASGSVDYVRVEGDGYHYHLTIVSDAFSGKTRVARQQWVYALLNEYIVTGQLHAINMKTWTKDEWEKQRG